MGLKNLRERFNDPYMAEVFQGMFPTDNPRNTRFAINFFTAIGLGGLTDGLRLHLKNAPKMIMEAQVRRASDFAAPHSPPVCLFSLVPPQAAFRFFYVM